MSMHQNTKAGVTVLGLGTMGTALARTFLAADNRVTVWNRTAGRADAVIAEGAKYASTAAEGVRESALVVVCVADYAAVRDILEPLEATLAGRAVVNLSSGTAGEARALAGWMAERDVRYVDGAVMAGPSDLGSEEARILFSGDARAYEQHRLTFEAVAGRAAFLGEDAGLASIHDVAVLAMMWSILNGFLHGAALLKRAGTKATDFLPIAQSGITTTAGWLGGYAEQVDAGEYPNDDATMATHVAAMQHLLDETVEARVDVAVPAALKALADRAIAADLADRGYAALIEVLLAERT